jgi:hypothetical protein
MSELQDRPRPVPSAYGGTAFAAPPQKSSGHSDRQAYKSGISALAQSLVGAVSAAAEGGAGKEQKTAAEGRAPASAMTRPRRPVESVPSCAPFSVNGTLAEPLLLAVLLLLLLREGAEGGVLGALGTLFLLCL